MNCNCNCKQVIEAKLHEMFVEKEPTATSHHVELTGYGVTHDSKKEWVEIGCMEFQKAADFPLKKGGTKRKTQRARIFFNYCPFCGEPAMDAVNSELRHSTMNMSKEEIYRLAIESAGAEVNGYRHGDNGREPLYGIPTEEEDGGVSYEKFTLPDWLPRFAELLIEQHDGETTAKSERNPK